MKFIELINLNQILSKNPNTSLLENKTKISVVRYLAAIKAELEVFNTLQKEIKSKHGLTMDEGPDFNEAVKKLYEENKKGYDSLNTEMQGLGEEETTVANLTMTETEFFIFCADKKINADTTFCYTLDELQLLSKFLEYE